MIRLHARPKPIHSAAPYRLPDVFARCDGLFSPECFVLLMFEFVTILLSRTSFLLATPGLFAVWLLRRRKTGKGGAPGGAVSFLVFFIRGATRDLFLAPRR
jgi:hypothetical protein